MRKKYSIGLLILGIAMIGLLYYNLSGLKYKNEISEETKQQASVLTQGDAASEDIYYIMELNGYLAVYESNQKVLYEYTNINIEELPEDIQREVYQGLKIYGIQNVYGFLENYSS